MIGERPDPIAELFAPARACEPTTEEIARASAVVVRCSPRRGRGLRLCVAVWTALVIAGAGFAAMDAQSAAIGRHTRRAKPLPGAVSAPVPLSFTAAAALEQTRRSARRHDSARRGISSTGTRPRGAGNHGGRVQIATRSARRGVCARAPGRLLVAGRCPARAAPMLAARPV